MVHIAVGQCGGRAALCAVFYDNWPIGATVDPTMGRTARLNGVEEFCVLAAAGGVYHETPPESDAAQLCALMRDAGVRLFRA